MGAGRRVVGRVVVEMGVVVARCRGRGRLCKFRAERTRAVLVRRWGMELGVEIATAVAAAGCMRCRIVGAAVAGPAGSVAVVGMVLMLTSGKEAHQRVVQICLELHLLVGRRGRAAWMLWGRLLGRASVLGLGLERWGRRMEVGWAVGLGWGRSGLVGGRWAR